MISDTWCGTQELLVGHLVNQELRKIASGELHAEFGLSIPTHIQAALGGAILEVRDADQCPVQV